MVLANNSTLLLGIPNSTILSVYYSRYVNTQLITEKYVLQEALVVVYPSPGCIACFILILYARIFKLWLHGCPGKCEGLLLT